MVQGAGSTKATRPLRVGRKAVGSDRARYYPVSPDGNVLAVV